MIESEYLKDNLAVIAKLRQLPTLAMFDDAVPSRGPSS